MGVLLEAGYDLGGLALCYVAIAGLIIATGLCNQVAKLLDFSVLHVRPLHFLSAALQNTVVSYLNSALQGVERAAAMFESGLIQSLELLIGLTLLAFVGMYDALSYLWSALLRPLIHSIADPIAHDAEQALAKATGLAGTIADDLDKAEQYARGQASSALSTARSYADKVAGDAKTYAFEQASHALSTAQVYADSAVGKLRAAEDAAISNAVTIANVAQTTGLAAARDALTESEALARSLVSGAESAADQAIAAVRSAEDAAIADARAAAAAATASAQAVGQASLAAVRSIAIDADNDLHVIEGAFGAAGIAALIGAIPALGTLVNAIATESGLENASCRTKVKGICGTEPNAWAKLLEDAALVGIGFGLAELVTVARDVIDTATPLMEQFG